MGARGFSLSNADITVVAQLPKLAPHREAMCSSIAAALSAPRDRVNVKATTTEQLGAIGLGEGIACHAVVLLEACE